MLVHLFLLSLFLWFGWFGVGADHLLDAATVFGLAISEFETRFGTVLLQEGQLFGIDGTTPFLSNELDGIFVLHAEFNESQGNQDGGTSQTGHTMHCHARSRFSTAPASSEQVKPLIDHVRGGEGAVVEDQVRHFDALLAHLLHFVRRFAHPNHILHVVFLQFLYKIRDGLVSGPVSDEEPHFLVRDFRRSGTNDLLPHAAHRGYSRFNNIEYSQIQTTNHTLLLLLLLFNSSLACLLLLLLAQFGAD